MTNKENNKPILPIDITLPIYMYTPKADIKSHKQEYMDAFEKVLDHGLFINGPELKELETNLTKYVDTKHCICVGNGTDALEIALRALDIGPGDEVITVAHTWISTAEAIGCVNAKPVFVDIEDNFFNIDPDKLEEKITQNTKAIIAVSLYGQTPDLDKINSIANKYNIPVIEDGAQSFGATYKGKKSCSLTTVGTTSFFPSKPLGGFGDGGACFTNDDRLANKIRAIKNHGCLKRFHHDYIGRNSRLDTMQAALIKIRLKYLDNTLKKRNIVANYYNNTLRKLEEQGLCELPKTGKDNYHVWAQYSILLPTVELRDMIFSQLKEYQIFPSIFYPAPLHTQKCFEYLGYTATDLPVTQDVSSKIINLPCYGELDRVEQEYVCKVFIKLLNETIDL